jgi:hypothetical protein
VLREATEAERRAGRERVSAIRRARSERMLSHAKRARPVSRTTRRVVGAHGPRCTSRTTR